MAFFLLLRKFFRILDTTDLFFGKNKDQSFRMDRNLYCIFAGNVVYYISLIRFVKESYGPEETLSFLNQEVV